MTWFVFLQGLSGSHNLAKYFVWLPNQQPGREGWWGIPCSSVVTNMRRVCMEQHSCHSDAQTWSPPAPPQSFLESSHGTRMPTITVSCQVFTLPRALLSRQVALWLSLTIICKLNASEEQFHLKRFPGCLFGKCSFHYLTWYDYLFNYRHRQHQLPKQRTLCLSPG